jgi:hypothetical protein
LTFGQNVKYQSYSKCSNLPPQKISYFPEAPKYFSYFHSTSVFIGNWIQKIKKHFFSCGPVPLTRPNPLVVPSLHAAATWTYALLRPTCRSTPSLTWPHVSGKSSPNPSLRPARTYARHCSVCCESHAAHPTGTISVLYHWPLTHCLSAHAFLGRVSLSRVPNHCRLLPLSSPSVGHRHGILARPARTTTPGENCPNRHSLQGPRALPQPLGIASPAAVPTSVPVRRVPSDHHFAMWSAPL